MPTVHFDLIVPSDLTGDADADRIFELFEGDVTPTVSAGSPLLMCSVEAASFAEAVTATVRTLREAGYYVTTVQAAPEAVAA
jgi:hypothetical protein